MKSKHSSEERLLAYSEARQTLEPDVLRVLSSHLAECASCRDDSRLTASIARPGVARAAD